MEERKADQYRTLAAPSEGAIFKDRGSKFYGFAFPVTSEEIIKERIEEVKKTHYNARHWCYAWQLGKAYEHYRANDDGEPNNSAGMPIYGQLQAFDLTNTLVVVVRYFGGTKLGVGGLIQAYKTGAQYALEAAKIVTRTIDEEFLLSFEYPEMDLVMRTLKEHQIDILEQDMHLTCRFHISVRKTEAAHMFELFSEMYKVTIKKVEE
ncbi:IMPACT family protein [Altibacter sp. HG106]|uniref:IMPACT family protein n=1 Tax=Altibacter sp. HG106 TaxID=3023937 RepID=UPI00235034F8|nr:YigZ family protein [Altibacter sp. HG106]MDC7995597.1 YigZ family protein [Altibacter sp. HG106]